MKLIDLENVTTYKYFINSTHRKENLKLVHDFITNFEIQVHSLEIAHHIISIKYKDKKLIDSLINCYGIRQLLIFDNELIISISDINYLMTYDALWLHGVDYQAFDLVVKS